MVAPSIPPVSGPRLVEKARHPEALSGSSWLMAFSAEGLVGSTELWLSEFETGPRATVSIGVLPSHRRRGVGSALLRQTIQDLPKGTAIDILIPVEADDLRAFVSRRGFRRSRGSHSLLASIPDSIREDVDGYSWHTFALRTEGRGFASCTTRCSRTPGGGVRSRAQRWSTTWQPTISHRRTSRFLSMITRADGSGSAGRTSIAQSGNPGAVGSGTSRALVSSPSCDVAALGVPCSRAR